MRRPVIASDTRTARRRTGMRRARRAGNSVAAALVLVSLPLGGCDSCRQVAAPPAPLAAQPTAPPSPVPTPLLAPTGPAAGAPPPASAGQADSGDCIVVADANPDYGRPPLTVALSAEAECSTGKPQYRWNFGDGSPPGTDANPTHVYQKAGDYTVAVTVTGPDGAVSSDEVDVTVDEEAEGDS